MALEESSFTLLGSWFSVRVQVRFELLGSRFGVRGSGSGSLHCFRRSDTQLLSFSEPRTENREP